MHNTVTPNGFGLGLLPDLPDKRDRVYAPAPTLTPFKFVDLRKDKATPPIWNQGQLGSCSAHATLGAFLFAAKKAGVKDPMLSRLQLYYNSRALEGTTSIDNGAFLRDAIKAAASGLGPESLWPYKIKNFAVAPPASVVSRSKNNMVIEYMSVGVSIDSIQASLTEGFPVIIGMDLFPSFESDRAINSGFVPNPTASEQTIGAHAMCVWGIGKGKNWLNTFPNLNGRINKTSKYFLLRNSWGKNLYKGGYLLTPVENVINHGSDFWTIRKVS